MLKLSASQIAQSVRVALIANRCLGLSDIVSSVGVRMETGLAEVLEELASSGEIALCENPVEPSYAWLGSRSHQGLVRDLSEILYHNRAGLVHASIFSRAAMSYFSRDEINLAVMDLAAQGKIESAGIAGGRLIHRWIGEAPVIVRELEAEEAFIQAADSDRYEPRCRRRDVKRTPDVGSAERPSVRTLAGKALLLIETKPGITRKEIAEIVGASVACISTNIDWLRRSGFIRRDPSLSCKGWYPAAENCNQYSEQKFNELADMISSLRRVKGSGRKLTSLNVNVEASLG